MKQIIPKKSIAFFSYDLNHEKYLIIENYAKQALKIKNEISKKYFNEYFNKIKISKTDFLKEMKFLRKIKFPKFSVSTFQQICMDVYEIYNKKGKKIKNQVEFKKIKFYRNKFNYRTKNI